MKDVLELFGTPKKNAAVIHDYCVETAQEIEEVKNFKTYIPEVLKWLPLAAKEYRISANINDYVVVPVTMFPSDLPNRNSVAFPYEELMRFNVEAGCPTYKTWRGKPTFSEHAHDDYRAAKGIIFDVYMKKMTNVVGDLYKVIALCGFDRTKDPELANAIATRKRTRYSMGASIMAVECSVCGAFSPKNNPKNTKCGHVNRGRISLFETAAGTKPAYYLARGISGFEISSVAVPAWVAAEESDNIFDLGRV
jgi:hypothetical protein